MNAYSYDCGWDWTWGIGECKGDPDRYTICEGKITSDFDPEEVRKTMDFLDEMDAGPTYSAKELHDATVEMIEWYDNQGEEWPLDYGPELSNPDLAAKIFVNYTADAGPDYIQEN